jgi:hypothetical protein
MGRVINGAAQPGNDDAAAEYRTVEAGEIAQHALQFLGAIHAALIERGKQGRANCSGQAPERHGITSDEFFERMQRVELAEPRL